MRDLQVEVLRDVLYCAMRQVLRDNNIQIAKLRKAYDVVYYQVRTAYYTFSLREDDGQYVLFHTEQDYDGDIKSESANKISKQVSLIDFMVFLYNILNVVIEQPEFNKPQ